jgi:hypothetical protein
LGVGKGDAVAAIMDAPLPNQRKISKTALDSRAR